MEISKFSFFQIGSGQPLHLRQCEELRGEKPSRRGERNHLGEERGTFLGEEGALCDWMKMQGWLRTASGDKRKCLNEEQ